jgi:uncharacterized membrane protein
VKISEIKKDAKAALKGSWLSAWMSFFVYNTLLGTVLGLVGVSPAMIILLLLVLPLSLGVRKLLISIERKQTLKFRDFLSPCGDLIGSLGIILWKFFLIAAWSVAFVIPIILSIILMFAYIVAIFHVARMHLVSAFFIFIIVGFAICFIFLIPTIVAKYRYSMAYFVHIDDDEITARNAIKKSVKLMYGNKMRLFLLNLSFIGWKILTFLIAFVSGLVLTAPKISVRGFTLGAFGDIFMSLSMISYTLSNLIDVYQTMANVIFYENLLKNEAKAAESDYSKEYIEVV